MQSFALRSYRLDPIQAIGVNVRSFTVEGSTAKPMGHHVIIVDRSGSMYSDLASIKANLEKVLTLQEFASSQMLVSLFSYSSQGDMRSHFQRVPVGDVMAPNSPHVQSIREMHVTGLTCISQGLKAALSVIRKEENTVVTLHSDGYANDPSTYSEVAKLEGLAKEIKGSNVLLNTIAYRNYCDFPLLSRLAAMGGGRCIQARDARDVFTVIQETSTLLGTGPQCVDLPSQGEGTTQIALIPAQKRVVGSQGDLKIPGVSPGEEVRVYTYRPIPVNDGLSPAPEAILAYAYFCMSSGRLNEGKAALLAHRNPALIGQHLKALTGPQIKAMMEDMEEYLFGDDLKSWVLWSPPDRDISLMDILPLWEEHRSHVLVNMGLLKREYKSLGVRRLTGVRGEDGSLQEPKEDCVLHEEEWMPVYKFVFSREEANVNLTFEFPITIKMRDSGAKLNKVAGVDLKGLTTYRNYSLIHNGEVYIPVVDIKFTSKEAFRAFQALGVVDTREYDPEEAHLIPLRSFPLTSYESSFSLRGDVFDRLLTAKVLESFCMAALKEDSASLTPDQIKALKEFNLTGGLNYSPPTVNYYTDLQEEVNSGRIDSRPIFQVTLGSTSILNLGKLNSANKQMKDYFTVEGTDVEGASAVLESGVTFERKPLSARKKITPADREMNAVFDQILGVAPQGSVFDFIRNTLNVQVPWDLNASRDAKVEYLNKVLRASRRYVENTYRREIGPLAYTVATTGMLPDGLDASPAMTGEALVKAFPDISLSKKEAEGTFFVIQDNLILSIFEDREYFCP